MKLPKHRSADSRYGWMLVGSGLLSIGFTSAVFHTGSLLLVVVPDDAGWSRAATSTALASLTLGSGVWAPVVGTAIQRWGAQRAMTTSSLVLAAGLTALSLARNPEEMGLALLLLVAPGLHGTGSLAVYTVIQAWFRERRGLALSLADSGASLGTMFLVPLAQALIGMVGWRPACQTLALASILFVPLHLMTQRSKIRLEPANPTPSHAVEHSTSLAELLRQRPIWLVACGMSTSRFAFQLLITHQVVYLTDQGFDDAAKATVFALTGLAGLVGRPGFGWLSDRLGVRPAYGLLTACLLVAIGSLVASGQSGLMPILWLYAICMGTVLGVSTLLFARQLSDLAGSRSFASALGFGHAIGGVGGTLGVASAGLVYDATGTYLTSFTAAALMALVSLGCIWALGRGRPEPAKESESSGTAIA
jgi:predicted MFS family arabinose efflux permease